jgi:hypothetical protein
VHIMGRKDLFVRAERGENRLHTPYVSRETGVASVVFVGLAGSEGEERRGWAGRPGQRRQGLGLGSQCLHNKRKEP